MKIILDTCAIIWAISNPDNLSQRAKESLVHKDSDIYVSVISCAEIACASQRGKIQIDRHWKRWFQHYITLNNWTSFDINLKIIEEAFSLPAPFHNDPADRIIVATARLNACTVITGDRKILNYPHVDILW
jgi:PIN domain nuclease of toxin-antitoxin system